MSRMLFLAVAMLALTGCASGISSASLRLVDRSITFPELRKDPERYNGRHVMAGGAIIAVRNKSNGDELEVMQFRTDDRGEIIDTSSSEGRFIALSSTFLDPALYQPGRLVTVVGEVRGTVTMPLGQNDYTYPILGIREIRLWTPEDFSNRPAVHFGIGVGTIIR